MAVRVKSGAVVADATSAEMEQKGQKGRRSSTTGDTKKQAQSTRRRRTDAASSAEGNPPAAVPETSTIAPVPEGYVGQAKVELKLTDLGAEGYSDEDVREAAKSGAVLQAAVVEVYEADHVPTAVVQLSPRLAGLVPASEFGAQDAVRKPGRYMESFIGRLVQVVVREVDEANGIAACSRRAAREAMARSRAQELKRGEVVEGVVRQIAETGLILDIGGVTGFLPLADLGDASGRIRKGDALDVMVTDFDPAKLRASLSVRQIYTGLKSWGERVALLRKGAAVLGTVQAIYPGVEGGRVLVRLHPSDVIAAATMPRSGVLVPGTKVQYIVGGIQASRQRIFGSIRRIVD